MNKEDTMKTTIEQLAPNGDWGSWIDQNTEDKRSPSEVKLRQILESRRYLQSLGLTKNNRKADLIMIRQLISHWLYHKTKLTLKDIGLILDKHHSTLISGRRKINGLKSIGDKSIDKTNIKIQHVIERLSVELEDQILTEFEVRNKAKMLKDREYKKTA